MSIKLYGQSPFDTSKRRSATVIREAGTVESASIVEGS